MIDINALPFEAFEKYPSRNAGYDVLQKEFNKRYDWRAKNFDYARQHGEGQGKQDIFYGKDGRTILIDYDDTEREFYPDSHWDIYQLQDDGTVAIKAISLSEYDLGRGDSVSYVKTMEEDTLTGEKALQITAEIKRAEIAIGFRAAKEEFETKVAEGSEPVSIGNFIAPNITPDQTLPTVLPQDLFGNVAGDAKGQNAHFLAFDTWLESQAQTGVYREPKYPVPGQKYPSHDTLYYSADGELFIANYDVPSRSSEKISADNYAIYENGPNDALVRTTVSVNRNIPGSHYDQYVVGITRGLVLNPIERQRIELEKAFAAEYYAFSRRKQETEARFEAETTKISYKASGFKSKPAPV